MSTPSRPRRFFWVLGLLLLVGTLLGATWVLNQAPAGDNPPAPTGRPVVPDAVVCLGYVDVEPGLTHLHPLRPGRVTELLVKEGAEVKKGQLLLKVDSSLARAQLREAQAALAKAQEGKAKVEMLQQMQPRKIAQQEKAVEAARHKAASQAQDLAANKRLFESKPPLIPVEKYRASQEEAKFLKSLIEIEERKLDEVKAFDFGPDLRSADAEIELRKATVEKAQIAVAQHDVYAPGDGTILRLSATMGEPLSQQPKQPAMLFCPKLPRIIRAEVLQEWAHRVQVGQSAIIEDDTRAGPQWTGRVIHVSDWFSPRRFRLLEPFQMNDVRTLECLVAVNPGGRPLRINQRMRVIVK
ncbi:MAG: HlyD family secretion protein [Gemmataceae bacterium]|nr:HlyD family secretion protein [Gemmataceae bacterium]